MDSMKTLSATSRALYLFAMVLLILLAFALGTAGLNVDIVWVDEMYGLGNMGAFNPPYSPGDVVASLIEYSPDQMPLYFVLASQWGQLVGWSPVPMRYLSLLFGTLLVALTYRLSADCYDRRVALVASALICACAFFIWYLHEMRMYTLWPLVVTAHLWCYWRLTHLRRLGRGTWIAFVISASAAMYTHAFSVFVFLGLGAQHLLIERRSPRWREIWLAWSISAVTTLPQLPIFLEGLRGYASPSSRARHVALPTDELIAHLGRVLTNDFALLWLVILALGAATIVLRKDRTSLRFFTVVAVFGVSIVIANAVFPVISPSRVRYFMAAIPLYLIFIARSLFVVDRWYILAAPFLLLWALGAYQILSVDAGKRIFEHRSLQLDYPPIHRFTDALNGKTRPHDYLLGFAVSSMLQWPYKHGWTTSDYYLRALLGIDGDFVSLRLQGEELLDNLAYRLDGHPYLLVAYNSVDLPPQFDELVAAIEAEYTFCKVIADGQGVIVRRYVNALTDCGRDYSPLHYDNGIRIVDKFAAYDAADQTVHVVTGWEVENEALLDQFNFSLQLLGDGWTVHRQLDKHLMYHILKWHTAVLSTEGVPPGRYRVVIIVYDRYHSSSKVSE